MPVGGAVTFLADRGFGDTKLFAYAVERELALRRHRLSQDDPCQSRFRVCQPNLDLWAYLKGVVLDF